MNIFIATHPFGLCGDLPVKLLNETGWNITYNSLGRRIKRGEVRDLLGGIDGVIAGTESYAGEFIKDFKDLKVISRVGAGLDGIDFPYCQKNNIIVAYTPNAPCDSVADLAIAQIINLLRGIVISDKSVRDKRWNRILGVSIRDLSIGVLGVGRIGSRVIERLKPFNPNNIYACDIKPNRVIDGIQWVNKNELFEKSDLVTIHIPLNEKNYHFVNLNDMLSMKKGSYIVNTSRGPILNEKDLENCIYNHHLGGAALDVFENEPYEGGLREYDNVLFTAHIGASDRNSRFLMELGAAKNCIRVLNGEEPLNLVTEKDFE